MKLLVTSNFTFCHNVFQRLLQAMRRNEYLWSKGLSPGNKAFLMLGKGENAGNQHFLLFPQCFLPSHKTFCCCKCRNAFNCTWISKILSFGPNAFNLTIFKKPLESLLKTICRMENAGINYHDCPFLPVWSLFPQCFSNSETINFNFSYSHLQMLFIWQV